MNSLNLKKTAIVWKRVFSKPKYVIVFLAAAFLFYLMNGLIAAAPNAHYFFETYGILGMWKLFTASLQFLYGFFPLTFYGVIFLSVLVGTLVSLLLYRFDNFSSVRGGGKLGAIGLFFGMAAPGCAACGVGVVSFLGLGSALSVLPFHGKEILIVSILFTFVSILIISHKLYNPVCEFHIHKRKQS